MEAVLIMLRPDGTRRSFSVSRDVTLVGRKEDCDLRIPLPDVSRHHCKLVKDADYLRVEDLGSSNGTRINGERVSLAVLNAGDTLSVGPVNFILQLDGQPADDQLRVFRPAPTPHPKPVHRAAAPASPEDDIDAILNAPDPSNDDDDPIDFAPSDPK